MEYQYLKNKNLDDHLNNEISILDKKHCFPQKTTYTITKNTDQQFTITGNSITYKGIYENLTIKLIDSNNLTQFYLKTNISKNIKDIYRHDHTADTLATINYNDDAKLNKYIPYDISFENLTNNKTESLEMISDKNLQICDIFYKIVEVGSPLLGKITRENEEECQVELVSGVDHVFMLGLASFFYCKDIYKDVEECAKQPHRPSNETYDYIAREPYRPSNETFDNIAREPYRPSNETFDNIAREPYKPSNETYDNIARVDMPTDTDKSTLIKHEKDKKLQQTEKEGAKEVAKKASDYCDCVDCLFDAAELCIIM